MKIIHLFEISLGDKTFILDLELNRNLISDRFVEVIFDDNDQRVKTKVHPERCHYHGTIRDVAGSDVVLQTCNGLKGMFSSYDTTYYIEPHILDEGDQPEMHIVYKHEDQKDIPVTKCGHNHTESDDDHHHTDPIDERMEIRFQDGTIEKTAKSMYDKLLKRKKRSGNENTPRSYNENLSTRYIELYIVTDKTAYERYGSNITAIRSRTLECANIVDSIYKYMNVRVVLVGVEVWTASDKAVISVDHHASLDNFCAYKAASLPQATIDHDVAQLITGFDFTGSVAGYAPVESMCSSDRSCGVNMDFSDIKATAQTMAHEMGHNLGMNHDDGRSCGTCHYSKGCIMGAVSGPNDDPMAWTQCSVDDINSNTWMCLTELPSTNFAKMCGNGIKEEGEECDCGTEAECPTADPCCQTTGCKLKPSSDCGEGPCCLNCQFKAEGTLCRSNATDCDVEEYCTGTQSGCPADNYKADGTVCTVGGSESYCYTGQCRTHTTQCEYLFGSNASIADNFCYDNLNVRGDQFGHCGETSTDVFATCAAGDVLCGRVQCKVIGAEDEVSLPVIGTSKSGTLFTSTITKNGVVTVYKCNGGDADFGKDSASPGMVADGTKCGTEKMCIKQTCKSFADISNGIGPDCPVVNGQMCAGRGVCNQDNKCICSGNYDYGTGCNTVVNANSLLTCLSCSNSEGCANGTTLNDTVKCTSNEEICQVVRLERTGADTYYTRGCALKTQCSSSCTNTANGQQCTSCCNSTDCNTDNGGGVIGGGNSNNGGGNNNGEVTTQSAQLTTESAVQNILTCYSCSGSSNDSCSSSATATASSATVKCSSADYICQVVQLKESGNATYTRGCVLKSSCTEECQNVGNQQSTEQCTKCCSTNTCNSEYGSDSGTGSIHLLFAVQNMVIMTVVAVLLA